MVFSGVFPLGTVDVRKTDIGYWVETLGGTMGLEGLLREGTSLRLWDVQADGACEEGSGIRMHGLRA